MDERRQARAGHAYTASEIRLAQARRNGAPERVVFAELRLQAQLTGEFCVQCLDLVWAEYQRTGRRLEPPNVCPGHD